MPVPTEQHAPIRLRVLAALQVVSMLAYILAPVATKGQGPTPTPAATSISAFCVYGAGAGRQSDTSQLGDRVVVNPAKKARYVGGNARVTTTVSSNMVGIRAVGNVTIGSLSGADPFDASLGYAEGIVSDGAFQASAGSHVQGNVDAASAVLGASSRIDGNLTVAGTVTADASATVGGTATEAGSPMAFAALDLPAPKSYNASAARADDRTVATGATLTLEPGTYRDLNAQANSTVELRAGTYVFDRVTLAAGATLALDATDGSVTILAAGNVNLGSGVSTTVKGGDASDVYLETRGTFKTGTGATWKGTAYSTKSDASGKAGIDIGASNAISGILRANQQFDVNHDTVIECTPFVARSVSPAPLPAPDATPTATPTPNPAATPNATPTATPGSGAAAAPIVAPNSVTITPSYSTPDPALQAFAIYGAGVSADATVLIGTNAIVRGGLVGATNDVTAEGGANLVGSRAGRDTSLGTSAGGPNGSDPTLGWTQRVITDRALGMLGSSRILGNADAATATLGTNARIDGNLTTSGGATFASGATVGGTYTAAGSPATFSPLSLPTPSTYLFNINDQSCSGAGCTSLTLAPGAYGDLTIGSNKTLNLSAGRYDFGTVSINGGTIINVDVAAGNVEVYSGSTSTNAVSIGTGVTVNILHGSARNFYFEAAGQIDIAGSTLWRGTIYSTNVDFHQDVYSINFGSCDTIVGALYSSHEVQLGSGSVLHYEPYVGWFPSGPLAPSPLWTGCQPPPPTSAVVTTVYTGTAGVDEAAVGGPLALGTVVHDKATVTTSGPAIPAGSTLTFTLYKGPFSGDCTTGSTVSTQSGVAISGASAQTRASNDSPALGAGDYAYRATFTSGDTGVVPSATGSCEPFSVSTGETTTTTVVHNAAHSVVTDVPVGTMVHDKATVGPQADSLVITGTITYDFFKNGSCDGTPFSSETVAVGSESSPQLLGVGDYSYRASYNGDVNYLAANSGCEPFSVQTSAIVTTVYTGTHGGSESAVTAPLTLG
ncbi:MAG: hypothetical protein ACRDF7_08000, partial [Candidatus Limnocylindrales bacterium]